MAQNNLSERCVFAMQKKLSGNPGRNTRTPRPELRADSDVARAGRLVQRPQPDRSVLAAGCSGL
jgi:hypothetical protein